MNGELGLINISSAVTRIKVCREIDNGSRLNCEGYPLGHRHIARKIHSTRPGFIPVKRSHSCRFPTVYRNGDRVPRAFNIFIHINHPGYDRIRRSISVDRIDMKAPKRFPRECGVEQSRLPGHTVIDTDLNPLDTVQRMGHPFDHQLAFTQRFPGKGLIYSGCESRGVINSRGRPIPVICKSNSRIVKLVAYGRNVCQHGRTVHFAKGIAPPIVEPCIYGV